MYQVLEDGKPCDSKNFDVPVNCGWDESTFGSVYEAVDYAKAWWGKFYIPIPFNNFGNLEPGKYNMTGSTCEIVPVTQMIQRDR
jgi:hypothetical protein